MLRAPNVRKAPCRAFTLVELLVVIAIIGLLIAILLPSLNRARAKAKGLVCLSNMRNLMQAVYLYTGPKGKFPTAGLTHGGQDDDTERSWVEQLAETYGRGSEIIRCPMDESEHWERPLDVGTLTGRLRKTSFASTSYTAYPIGNYPVFSRFEQIHRPSDTIFWVELAEVGEFAAADHVHPENWWFGDPRELASQEMQLDRHEGKSHYGMMDGHAQPYVFEDTYEIDPEGGFPPKFLHNRYDPTIGR